MWRYMVLLSLIVASTSFVFVVIEPPEKQIFKSDNNKYFLVIHPNIEVKRKRKNSYDSNLKKKKRNLDTLKCFGEFYMINKLDTLQAWRKNLVNPVAPLFALISNNGKRIITFNDYYTHGFTDNDCVIYNEYGEMLNRFNVSELASGAYPGSVSSVNWLKEYSITNDTLTLTMNNSTSPNDSIRIKLINSVVKIELNKGVIVK